MSPMNKSLAVAAAVVWCACACTALPTPRSVDLAEAVNRTVCPIRVEVDEDPGRVPRRIKVLRCAPDPRRWCHEQRLPPHECCAHNHNHHVMECVEIHDRVLVKYPASGTTKIYDVAVGCSCMVHSARAASTIPPPP